MTKYRLNHKLLKRLLKDNLILIVLLIVLGPIYIEWRSGEDFELNELWLKVFGGMFILMNLPSLILYLQYYFVSKDTELQIDRTSKRINIIKNGSRKEYDFEQIEHSVYNLAIYYKNAIDRAGRIPMMISDFRYWDVQFKNGDRYLLTNLIVDFLLDSPFVENTEYRFRFIPYLDTSKYVKPDLQKHQPNDDRIRFFLKQYKSKNKSELIDIISNRKKYQVEAVLAAEKIINKKTLGNGSCCTTQEKEK